MSGKKVVRLSYAALAGMFSFALASGLMSDYGIGLIAGIVVAGIAYYLLGAK